MITTIITAFICLALAAITFVTMKHWPGDRFLCDTCKYNSPEACNKKERPRALVCYAFKEWDK